MILNGKYYLSDIESGQWYEVSKEYHDSYIEYFENIMKSMSKKFNYKGTSLIVGTSNNSDKQFSFKDLWK